MQITIAYSLFFILLLHPEDVVGRSMKSINVDLAGPGCDLLGGQMVGDWDMVRIFHNQNFNAISTRDDCEVTLRAADRRRLQYSIDTLAFYGCGVTINIFHDPRGNFNPQHTFDCNSRPALPIRDKSAVNVLRLTIRRTNPSTTDYVLALRVMNDMDLPTEEFPTGKSFDEISDDYEGEAMDPGIIAGIAIAGAIIIVALILLAIYLCVRARQTTMKDDGASSMRGESSVYTSGNSQVLFSTKERQPRGRYGSMEDIHSTTSQEKAGANGAYTNPAYTTGPREKGSERQASVGRARGKTSFDNGGFDEDDMGSRTTYDSWEENEVRIGSFRRAKQGSSDVNIGSFRRSRRDEFQHSGKKLKSAMKKPTDIELSKVSTQPNGILKAPRTRSPNRSQTSSTEGSFDLNNLMYGYGHNKAEHPNIRHKPVIERRRSRSGTRSNRSTSSAGSHGRRSQSADRKQKPKAGGRMYSEDVFIANSKPRSSSRNRARSNSLGRRRDRGSDSLDSESSVASSRRVSMNPGGKRVHIKGEETDI